MPARRANRLTSRFLVSLLPLLASLPRAASSMPAGPAGTWHVLPPGVPSGLNDARHAQSLIYDPVGDRTIEFGGFDSWIPGPVGDLRSYVPCDDAGWQVLVASGTAPTPRYGHSAIYDPVRQRMILFGGATAGATPSGQVFALSLGGSPAWSTLGNGPTPRFGHSAIYDPVRDRMIVFGGYDGANFLNEVWVLTLSGTPTWSQLTPTGTPPSPRDFAGVIYDPVRDRLLLFGGNDGDAKNDLWSLSLGPAPAWTSISASGSLPGPRLSLVAIYDPIADALVISGGTNSPFGPYSDVRSLTLAGTPAWLPAAPVSGDPLPAARDRAGVYLPGPDVLLLHGGTVGYSLRETDQVSLRPTLKNMTLQPDEAPTLQRFGATLVFDPVRRRILLHGGAMDTNPDDVSSLLTMSLDSPGVWKAPCVAAVRPTPRQGHCAVYDPVRDRILMFGGYDGGPSNFSGGFCNDLWALSPGDPLVWTQLAPTGTPPARRDYASLVYDSVRDRLVLFAGFDSLGSRNDVWGLSLSSGTPAWSPIVPSGTPPTTRLSHCAIYDAPRDRMVVFGGSNGGTFLSDAWELDFSPSPHWAPMATGVGPSGRKNASLVDDTTRDRLILFGGVGAAGSLNDLWELPLTGGNWSSLVPSSPIAPLARHSQAAIYDPVQDAMMFEGGYHSQRDSVLSDTWVLGWGGVLTPALVSLVSSEASPERVRLLWEGSSGTAAAVLRREGGAEWKTLASVHSGDGRWEYEDTDVVAGGHYEYALDLGEGPQARVEISVPSLPRFSFAGLSPSPASARSRLVFSLPVPGPVHVEVFDVAGRRVAREELGTLSSGSHRTPLATLARLGPGVYVMKLAAAGGALTAPAVIVR